MEPETEPQDDLAYCTISRESAAWQSQPYLGVGGPHVVGISKAFADKDNRDSKLKGSGQPRQSHDPLGGV
jgi:hypothetical protein